jgi:DNA-binding protein
MKGAIDEAHLKLRSGDIQNALDTYQFVYNKYSKDSEILINYMETIESESSHLHFGKYPHI